ncbi:MAG: prolipoprotein diacylglyceryl transferase [Candidatus Faecivicinus sp.]
MIRISRTAIELFGLSVHWYGVLIVTGIALGAALAMARERWMGLPKDTALDLALVCVPAAIVGARLYFVAFSWDQYAGGPWWRIFAVWEGGMAIYGGVIAGVLAGWLYARAKKLSFWKLTDLVAPCIPLGQAIGRWGNFINQEAHGAQVLNPALQFFPVSVEIGGAWYYATFFYESVWCFLIVAALLIAERRSRFRRDGDAFCAYVYLYALERGVVEGMRTDSLMLGGLRVSQGLSLLMALIVAVCRAVRCKSAPMALRLLAPGCVLAAVALAAAGYGIGTLAASAASLIAMAAMGRWTSLERKTENRGDE